MSRPFDFETNSDGWSQCARGALLWRRERGPTVTRPLLWQKKWILIAVAAVLVAVLILVIGLSVGK